VSRISKPATDLRCVTNMKKLIAAFILSTMASLGHAAVVVDSQTASGLNATTGINQWNMQLSSGVNRALFVECHQNLGSTVDISSITVGVSTNALTMALRHKSSINQVEIWYTTAPPTGLQQIQVNAPGISASSLL
jgi:hypothetical protein